MQTGQTQNTDDEVVLSIVPANRYEILIKQGDINVLVASVFLVAYVAADDSGHWIDLVDLFVSPEYRNQGYGALMIEQVVDTCHAYMKDEEITFIHVCVQIDDTGSELATKRLEKWYSDRGFKKGSPFHVDDNWMSLKVNKESS